MVCEVRFGAKSLPVYSPLKGEITTSNGSNCKLVCN